MNAECGKPHTSMHSEKTAKAPAVSDPSHGTDRRRFITFGMRYDRESNQLKAFILITGLMNAVTSGLAATPPSGKNERSRQPPTTETFIYSPPALEMSAWNGDYEYSDFRVDEDNGKEFGTLDLRGIRRADARNRESYRMHYGRLYQGDVVPMFTALYRVAAINARRNEMTVKRIDDPSLLKEIGVAPESYAVPENANVRLGTVDFKATVWRPNPSVDAGPTALVSASFEIRDETGALRKVDREFPSLRSGDSIEVGDSNYSVRKIVPADADRQIRGWVELTPIREKQVKN